MNNIDQLTPVTLKTDLNAQEIYFKVWEREQEHTKTRWNVTTFFVSISFAIFGISLQTKNPSAPPIISHVAALAVYWFAFVLFWRFNSFTNYLRDYLRNMESSAIVNIDVQTKMDNTIHANRWISTFNLLFYFGVFYTVAVGLLWWK
ncbi:MAG: hypothetical protein KI793_06180 [Rivularia sp. (in: Bacteria)]|nr:hypothetical protein [Rivularia sp. MS3]